jgi:hypothetical protein
VYDLSSTSKSPLTNKIKVTLNANEMLEYKGYLKRMAEATTVLEVNTYHQRAMKLLKNASSKRKKGVRPG